MSETSMGDLEDENPSPKIEVSNLEVSLMEINTGAGIIEFFRDSTSGRKRFSFSSTEGEDRRLDETFNLSEYHLTKAKSQRFIRLTPSDGDQKSIFITFKSMDSYELFLANSSDGGGSKKPPKSKSFQLRRRRMIVKRVADTVYEDHFSEEEIDESDLQLVKRDDVDIRSFHCSRSRSSFQENSSKRTSSDEDWGEEEDKDKEEGRTTVENQGRLVSPGPLKSDDDLSNSDSEKKTSSEEDEGEEGATQNKGNKKDVQTINEKRVNGCSAISSNLKRNDNLSDPDSEAKGNDIEEKEETNAILERTGHLAKDRRHRSKNGQ